ncbi:MAG: hypothetical protein KatS3mg027_0351 [Bacteroidia bacterium]|nr:MAG: hypothetical protein KatS3mg027_0351 [Bacteroidia bacterium]
MKTLVYLLNLVFFLNFIFSQNTSLERISYQGVARDANGGILSNQPIGLRFLIHQGYIGNPVFTEDHVTSTNSIGIFTVAIGSNTSLNTIDWRNGPFFLEVQMDPNGGTSYVPIGTQQILSVPYAMYSKKAETVINTGTSTAWSTEGNYQTDSTLNFIGTKDNFPLIFKTANNERMRITKTGKIRIGSSIIQPPSLLSVFGNINDTVIAHFSNTNSFASVIDVYNFLGYSGITLRSGTGNIQDTSFIFTKQGHGLLVRSTKKVDFSASDSIKIFSQNGGLHIGTPKNINIYSLSDSIKIYGRNFMYYTANPSLALDAGLTINFGNTGSNYASALKINHSMGISTSNVSYGIYLNNNALNSSSLTTIVGLGSYFSSFTGTTVNRKGIDVYASGLGNNIGIFTQADGGNLVIDGYANWSIYSNAGNVMIRDGHIKSSSYTSPSIFVYPANVTALLFSTSTDVKGNVELSNILAGYYAQVDITFSKPYASVPVVLISLVDNGLDEAKNVSYYISWINNSGFSFKVYNNNTSVPVNNIKINYWVIE